MSKKVITTAIYAIQTVFTIITAQTARKITNAANTMDFLEISNLMTENPFKMKTCVKSSYEYQSNEANLKDIMLKTDKWLSDHGYHA